MKSASREDFAYNHNDKRIKILDSKYNDNRYTLYDYRKKI